MLELIARLQELQVKISFIELQLGPQLSALASRSAEEPGFHEAIGFNFSRICFWKHLVVGE